MNRDDIRALIGATIFAIMLVLSATALADEPKLPAGYTCADVRALVAEIGRYRALALALERGASWTQIKEAKKCLK